MFSKSCEYAIRASIYIARESLQGRKVSLKEVVAATDSPEAFTAKVLQKLTKVNVLSSVKGPGGGFFVTDEDLSRVKLWNIVFAIDGKSLYHDCSMGLKKCNENKPCPLHFKFKEIRDVIKENLETTSLRTLAEEVIVGNTYLKR